MTVTPIPDQTPAALPTTQKPRIAWVSKQRRTTDGRQLGDANRMRVGEILVVRVGVRDVDPGALRNMGSMLVSDALSRESLSVDESGDEPVIEIAFRATKIGAEHVQMAFIPAGTAASDQLTASVEAHVEMDQEAFRGQLQEASQYSSNAYHAANLYMHKVSPPYREGWEKVKETLEKASEPNPFNEIVVHLAMTFIAGLAGGRVAGSCTI